MDLLAHFMGCYAHTGFKELSTVSYYVYVHLRMYMGLRKGCCSHILGKGEVMYTVVEVV